MPLYFLIHLKVRFKTHLPRLLKLTPHYGREIVDLDTSATGELAEQHFQVVHGFSHQNQDDQVGDYEGSSAVLQSGEGKSPDVSQTHTQCDAGHKELDVVVPTGPLFPLLTSLHSRLIISWRCSRSWRGHLLSIRRVIRLVCPWYRDGRGIQRAHKRLVQVSVVIIVVIGCGFHVAAANQSTILVVTLTFNLNRNNLRLPSTGGQVLRPQLWASITGSVGQRQILSCKSLTH